MTNVDSRDPVRLLTRGQRTPFFPDRRVGALGSLSAECKKAEYSSEGGSKRNPTHDYGRGGWDNEDIIDS